MYSAAAVTSLTASGTGNAALASMRARSANPPAGSAAEPSTRSPTAGEVTPSPVARTRPHTSSPGVNGRGGFTWYSPLHSSESAKFIAEAATSTRT